MPEKINVAVLGASGSAGGELCRLLLNHPCIRTLAPVSRGDEPFDRVHPNLLGCGLEFVDFEQTRARASEFDCVFFATPSGEAMKHAGYFLEKGAKVIDLSADFRFSDQKEYSRIYGKPHSAPELLEEAIYGVTEFAREEIRSARLIANPGCYVITALLTLVPLLNDARVATEFLLSIHALNGTSGAGSELKRELTHALAANSVLPYSLEGHRHAPEIERQIQRFTGRSLSIDFNTAHGSFPRGIYLQASVPVSPSAVDVFNREMLVELYQRFYGKGAEKEFFVRIVDGRRGNKINAKEYHLYPRVARVTGSNFCQIGIDYDPELRVVRLVGVIDNLVKGAAGSAIQNMNVAFGFSEISGLEHYGL